MAVLAMVLAADPAVEVITSSTEVLNGASVPPTAYNANRFTPPQATDASPEQGTLQSFDNVPYDAGFQIPVPQKHYPHTSTSPRKSHPTTCGTYLLTILDAKDRVVILLRICRTCFEAIRNRHVAPTTEKCRRRNIVLQCTVLRIVCPAADIFEAFDAGRRRLRGCCTACACRGGGGRICECGWRTSCRGYREYVTVHTIGAGGIVKDLEMS